MSAVRSAGDHRVHELPFIGLPRGFLNEGFHLHWRSSLVKELVGSQADVIVLGSQALGDSPAHDLPPKPPAELISKAIAPPPG